MSRRNFALPREKRNKIDLSYHNARLHPDGPSDGALQPKHPSCEIQNAGSALQGVLGRWIKSAGIPELSNESEFNESEASCLQAPLTLSENDRAVLHTRGYTVDDVRLWASILCNEDDIAAANLLLSSIDDAATSGRLVPIFVPLVLLRRVHIHPEAIRSVIFYAWWHLRDPETPWRLQNEEYKIDERTLNEHEHNESTRPRYIDRSSLFILVVRLLRHARKVLPVAFVTIARMYIKAFSSTSRSQRFVRSRRDYSAFMHNRLLRLLAIPPPASPFMYAPFQQQAQFEILGWMAAQKPPLPINREGYQSIAAVLLAQKKTDQEQDWANLKVKTWPPWKESKLGVDEDKGPEYGYSRALRAMILAFGAGYGSKWWNEVARILSGWDVDWSPTVQTTALLFHHEIWPSESHRESQRRKTLWIARISATRTVQEAWACFLAYEKEQKPVHQSVYLAMFRKLAARTDSRTPPPDSREVLPISSSPKEQTYVGREPPSMDQLALQMYENGERPSGHCLDFLLSHADRLDHGIKYMEWASQRDPGAEVLLSLEPDQDERLKNVDLRSFTAFVQLLCRFPTTTDSTLVENPSSQLMGLSARRLLSGLRETHPIFFCYRLMRVRRPDYLPPWISLMASFAYRRGTLNVWGGTRDSWINALHNWFFTLQIQDEMVAIGLPPSDLTLRILCRSAENAIFAALRIQETWAYREQASPHLKESVESVMNHTFGKLRRMFEDLMGSRQPPFQEHAPYPSGWSVPRVLANAHPEIVHSLIRVAGFLRDWRGMMDTVRWMERHEEELLSALKLSNRGHVVLQRAIVAIRVFCERAWLANDDQGLPPSAAPPAVVQELKAILETKTQWGGWPSNEQVEEYCQAQGTVLRRCPS
ncbi:MAG: hypothetical protein M1831_005246 [Alyxoria varia]|nr:MAG: hypothetical protein M1831_005246 [Alyxoria varia]